MEHYLHCTCVHSVNVPLPSSGEVCMKMLGTAREGGRERGEDVLLSAVQPRTKNVQYVHGLGCVQEWWLEGPGGGWGWFGGVEINRHDVEWYAGLKWIELAQVASCDGFGINPSYPSGHYMYRQFNIKQFYVLPKQYILCFVWV